MPLPKPSKMISKRFKKPKLASYAALPPPPDLPSTPRHAPLPCRKWRIRVVCTDPDATDDSSADEAEPSPARKRLIHEFSLPLPSPSPPSAPLRRRGSSPIHRPTRSLCRDLRVPKAEMNAFLDVASAAATILCPPSPPRSSSAESAGTEEEFTRFLQEFLPDEEEGGLWEYDVARSGSQQEAEMLDLELDSEALSWINSMQRVP